MLESVLDGWSPWTSCGSAASLVGGNGSGWIVGTHYPEAWSDEASNSIPIGQCDRTETFNADQWNQVVITYDGDRFKEYINGQMSKDCDTTGDPLGAGLNLEVGAWSQYPVYDYEGFIDELRVYGRALSSEEVLALYAPGWQAYTLTVARSGSGSGNVTSVPVGVDCGSNCSGVFTDGTVVTVAATASPGSIFSGWVGGGCDGQTTDCILPMTADQSITAIFSAEADLSIAKTDGQTTAVPGQAVTYTITATNSGPSDMNGATVSDAFPAALTGVTWTCSATAGASCSASGSGDISDSVDLPVGGVVTYSATGVIDVGATGMLSNTATVAVPADAVDPEASNNSATDSDDLTIGLFIPGRPGAAAGQAVQVPIEFGSAGHDIAAAAFSVDYDEACLSFDDTDGDGDGVPDAIDFQVPAAFHKTVFFDLGDSDGEIDVLIFDIPPVAVLPDGVLAIITFTTTCSPAPGSTLLAPVGFSSDPPVSFGDTGGQDLPGSAFGASVEIVPADLRGDCNWGGSIGAGDVTALGLEIFDGDGDFWLDTFEGTFPGSPIGCDPNADTMVDAGDVSCLANLIFGGSCEARGSSANGAPTLSLPAFLPASQEGTVVVPISFAGEPHAVTSVAFSLDFDQSLLSFDATDGDGDGLPDAVRFFGIDNWLRSVGFDPGDPSGELDFLLTDLASEPQTLTDGLLVEIELRLVTPASSVTGGLLFSHRPPASFGDVSGRSVPGAAEVSGVLFADGFESGDLSAWSAGTL